ncbi:uncharacterized protein LOC108266972 [Ictalurus punctatus]|uniref:Uncharacterized protein LOC108266972 n=1 Tax=Ictalurus punctatus TaxID=7998 RepID=A0A2D0R8B5_ICTPU|nr:uncharacterized protein LOC108266972 [Ictalurus punctatus]
MMRMMNPTVHKPHPDRESRVHPCRPGDAGVFHGDNDLAVGDSITIPSPLMRGNLRSVYNMWMNLSKGGLFLLADNGVALHQKWYSEELTYAAHIYYVVALEELQTCQGSSFDLIGCDRQVLSCQQASQVWTC